MYRNSIAYGSHNKAYSICTNCGISGHTYKQCIEPLMSYGLLVFKYTTPGWSLNKTLCMNENTINGTHNAGQLQILMVKRKDSLRFVEFIRGKYDLDEFEYLEHLLEEMTADEHELIRTKTFIELWQHVWGSSNPKNYRNDFEKSNTKFNHLKSSPGINDPSKTLLEELLEKKPAKWTEPEWGFPKGRRNPGESDLEVAIRETFEETNINESQLNIFERIQPLVESYFGDNKIYYCHKYYLCLVNQNTLTTFDVSNDVMTREISDIKWFSINDALNIMRPENVERKAVLLKANSIFKNFCPFMHGRLFRTPL
jgi:8-oxo-dGTP pyrophosphatase MutT (NUDIX family)